MRTESEIRKQRKKIRTPEGYAADWMIGYDAAFEWILTSQKMHTFTIRVLSKDRDTAYTEILDHLKNNASEVKKKFMVEDINP